MSERVGWDALPWALRAAIEERTGEVTGSETVPEGLNCSTALVLHVRRHGRLFLKGVHESHLDEVSALCREELINETVRGSPRPFGTASRLPVGTAWRSRISMADTPIWARRRTGRRSGTP